MKRNLMRKIVGGLSLTSALFVFQACYGTPQDVGLDFFIHGQVKSKTTGLPVCGIKVVTEETMQYERTDEEGRFSLYAPHYSNLTLRFLDTDSVQNGLYADKDTLLTNLSGSKSVYLDIVLEEK